MERSHGKTVAHFRLLVFSPPFMLESFFKTSHGEEVWSLIEGFVTVFYIFVDVYHV